MARKQEIKEFGGKKFRLNEIPPLEAIVIGDKWTLAFDNNGNSDVKREVIIQILSYVEVEIEKDRWIKLDSAELINQHTRVSFIITLCNAEMGLAFDFLKGGEGINS